MSRPEAADRAQLDAVAFTIPEFCDAHKISRAHYYTLKNRGLGPDEARLLGRVVITREAAAKWRRKHSRKSAA
jgi:hypothetical protein